MQCVTLHMVLLRISYVYTCTTIYTNNRNITSVLWINSTKSPWVSNCYFYNARQCDWFVGCAMHESLYKGLLWSSIGILFSVVTGALYRLVSLIGRCCNASGYISFSDFSIDGLYYCPHSSMSSVGRSG